MKFAIPSSQPRNPLVMPAARRSAGAHRARHARQQQQRELRRELQHLHSP